MADTLIINLTDPFEQPAQSFNSFNVRPYTANGPRFPTASLSTPLPNTSTAANTSLILYGKGHPNYGERLEENFIHLLTVHGV